MMVQYKHYYYNEGFRERLGTLGLLASLAFTNPLMSKPAKSLYDQLAQHEGVHNNMYRDSKGVLTIGIGFNLEDPNNLKILQKHGITQKQLKNGITGKQIEILFNESLSQAKKDAIKFIPDLMSHPVPVQNAIIDMSFNLGYPRLSKFINLKNAIQKKDYLTASKEMLNSLWAKQVKERANYLAELVKSAAPKPTKSSPLKESFLFWQKKNR